MGRGWSSRTREAEHAASAAWDELVGALDQASGTIRSMKRRTRTMTGNTTGRVGAAASEARWRATAARDALAGRRPRRPWAWIAGAVGLGAVLGLMAGAAARRAMEAEAEALVLEEAAAADAAAPVTLVEASVPIASER